MYKQGDIVLVSFPFTDLSSAKVRPALVLPKKEFGNDITVCFISSVVLKKIKPDELLIDDKNKNFKYTGLKTSSIVKVLKIATLEKKVILGKIGFLDLINMLKIKIIIKNHFDI